MHLIPNLCMGWPSRSYLIWKWGQNFHNHCGKVHKLIFNKVWNPRTSRNKFISFYSLYLILLLFTHSLRVCKTHCCFLCYVVQDLIINDIISILPKNELNVKLCMNWENVRLRPDWRCNFENTYKTWFQNRMASQSNGVTWRHGLSRCCIGTSKN